MKQVQAKCGNQAQLSCCHHDTTRAHEVTQGPHKDTFVHVGSISSVGAMALAEVLCLGTTFGLGLFHNHAIRNREAQRAPCHEKLDQISLHFEPGVASLKRYFPPGSTFRDVGSMDIYSSRIPMSMANLDRSFDF